MKEQTGETYESSKYEKGLFLSTAKDGKSCFLVGSILGVLPWQKHGGVVDRPSHLHVLSMDSDAMGGVMGFLTKTCNAPAEAMKFRIYNLQDDIARQALSKEGDDLTFYNTVMATLQVIYDRVHQEKGVHAILISSLTAAGEAFVRGLSGDPADRGGGMDMDKNNRFNGMLNQFRDFAQIDDWHCFWEAHLYKTGSKGQGGDGQQKDSLLLRGKAGERFPALVDHMFRIRRLHGQRYEGTKCDMQHLETRSSSDFVPGGRLFNEVLNEKEPDLTVALHKLGKSVGRWGAKAAPPKPQAANAVNSTGKVK